MILVQQRNQVRITIGQLGEVEAGSSLLRATVVRNCHWCPKITIDILRLKGHIFDILVLNLLIKGAVRDFNGVRVTGAGARTQKVLKQVPA